MIFLKSIQASLAMPAQSRRITLPLILWGLPTFCSVSPWQVPVISKMLVCERFTHTWTSLRTLSTLFFRPLVCHSAADDSIDPFIKSFDIVAKRDFVSRLLLLPLLCCSASVCAICRLAGLSSDLSLSVFVWLFLQCFEHETLSIGLLKSSLVAGLKALSINDWSKQIVFD